MSQIADGPTCDPDTPRVSVIVAAFNAEPTIQEAIGSIQAQTISDIEILVVDDGSTDGTADRVSAMLRGDRRIALHRLHRNRGVAVARNLALRHARGKWVAVVDADDRIVPDRFERLLTEAIVRNADMIADNMFFLETGPASTEVAFPATTLDECSPLTGLQMVWSDLPRSSTVSFGFLKPMMRRSFLVEHRLGYQEDLLVCEDFNLYLRAVMLGARFHTVSWAGYGYRRMETSLTRGPESSLRNMRMAIVSSNRLRAFAISRGLTDLAAALRVHRGRMRAVLWLDSLKWAIRQGSWWDRFRAFLSIPMHPIEIGRIVFRRLLLGRRRHKMEAPGAEGLVQSAVDRKS